MLFGSEEKPIAKLGLGLPGRSGSQIEDATALKLRIHQRLLEVLNLSLLDKATRDALRPEVRSVIGQFLVQEKCLLTVAQTESLLEDVLDELLGLGPLEPLLKDDSVSDILINTHNTVYVERAGRLEKTGVHFLDTRHLLRIVNKIVSAVGRRIDESLPMVDARLADGSRINAIIPPLAVDGPLVSIRKFAKQAIHMPRLIELGTVTEEMAKLLQVIVRCRRSMLISGGTGAGKTTFLNALSAFIDHRERVITIEDSAELQLQQPHVARLETRPPNIEGRGEVTPRDLVRNALRMRPDRIIIGEVRTGEAFDMLQAMNTGHEGCMTTVHANSPRDALSRVEQMIGMAGLDISPRSIRRQIASAINVVVQLERMDDGMRRVVSVSEIIGMEEDVIVSQEIYRFRRQGHSPDGLVVGVFEATGVRPKFLDQVVARGIEFAPAMFAPGRKSV